MFIDKQTGVRIYADLDTTVIRATMRTQDLIPAFLEVIKDTPEYAQLVVNNAIPSVVSDPTATDDDERWYTEAIDFFLNEELFDVLNDYAPVDYYFGSHIGDGSDFGYWKNEGDE